MTEHTTIAVTTRRPPRWGRRVLLALLAIVLVVIIALGLTQTQWFRDYLRDTLVASANDSLNGMLTVERLSGNLFNSAVLYGITLSQSGDTLIHIPRIALKYDLWPLLDREVTIEKLTIREPDIRVALLEDSTWNLSTIIRSEELNEPTATSISASKEWALAVLEYSVEAGLVRIAYPDSLIPSTLHLLSITGNAVYSRSEQVLTISQFDLIPSGSSVKRISLAGSVSLLDRTATLDTLVVSTERNRTNVAGWYTFDSKPKGQLSIIADSLDVREAAPYTGYNLPETYPSLRMVADLNDDSVHVTLDMRDNGQFVTATGWINSLIGGLTEDSGSPAAYSFDVNLSLDRLQDWIDDSLATGSMAGTLHVEGVGWDPADATGNADVTLSHGSVLGRDIDSSHVVAAYVNDSANVAISAQGEFGAVYLSGTVAAISDQFRYDVRLDARHVNLQPLVDFESPATDLSIRASATGRGYDVEQAAGRANATLSRSTIAGTDFDTLAAVIRFDPNLLTIDTFYVAGAPGSLSGAGTIGIDKLGVFEISANIGNTDWLTDWLDGDSLDASGSVTARVEGTLDSLTATGSFALSQVLYDSYRADSLSGQFSLGNADGQWSGDYSTRVLNLNVMDHIIPTTSLAGRIEPSRYTAILSTTVNDNLKGSLSAEYLADSIPVITVSNIDLQTGDQSWTSSGATARVRLATAAYEFDGLRLEQASDRAGQSQQYIAANGVYGFDSTHSIHLTARGIDLAEVVPFIDPTLRVSGILSLDVQSSGWLDNPEVRGTFSIETGAMNDYQYDELEGEFSLFEGVAHTAFALRVQGPESLVVAGSLPLAMLTDSSRAAPDTGLDVRIRSFGFTLTVLQAFGYTIENTEGDLGIDLRATHSLNDPRLDGQISVTNGRIDAPEYGIDYRNIAAHIRFDSSVAELTQFTAQRDQGTLLLTGRAEYSDGLVVGRLDAAELSLTAKDFYVVRHRHYEAQVSANVKLGGPVNQPQYDGTITVRRSNVYLPALSEDIGEGSSLTVPLLVAALQDTQAATEGAFIPVAATADTMSILTSEYVRNLRGRLQVRFPRNTWLRDDDMKIEIEGTLDVVKQGLAFELFGEITVVRGDYSLYGKKFRIQEGRLSFDGGSTFNPRLAIDAVYVFRTPNREKRSLTLSIGGRAENPTLAFSLDDSHIDEGDAVSYILFGRSIAELTSGQRSAISEDGGGKTDAAKGAIANLLTGQLTQTLGNEFSLDVIEINAQSDWQSASFVVGKYLTTDLFVSYQRGLGTTREDDEIVPEVVTLEYELSRHLFFQLVAAGARKSGFDVIVKFDKE